LDKPTANGQVRIVMAQNWRSIQSNA